LSQPKADECRERAALCDEQAEQARNRGQEDIAREFSVLADQWRALANQIEHYGLF
jgi:hypothetical protein